MDETQRCRICLEVKPLSEFHKATVRGVWKDCKKCTRSFDHDAIAEYMKQTGATVKSASLIYGCTTRTVYLICRKLGVSLTRPTPAHLQILQYVRDHPEETRESVGAKFGYSATGIQSMLTRLGFTTKTYAPRISVNPHPTRKVAQHERRRQSSSPKPLIFYRLLWLFWLLCRWSSRLLP